MSLTALDRRGRPRRTSQRDIEIVAMRLFDQRGFDETTVDDIARAAGVSRRTFFRYFDSKSAVLWNNFDREIDELRRHLSATDHATPLVDAIRQAVLAVNDYGADDSVELALRMKLINSVSSVQSTAAVLYAAWERVIAEFVGQRLAIAPTSLYAVALSRATSGACRAGFDQWLLDPDLDLRECLDEAMTYLATGFARP